MLILLYFLVFSLFVCARACESYFLDFGSNIGVQVRKLYQPELYANAPFLKYFDTVFGVNRVNVCTIGLEGNPLHTERLKAVQTFYVARGFNVTFMTETIAGVKDEMVQFYIDNEVKNEFWSSSIFDHSGNKRPVTVHEIDVAQLLSSISASIERRPSSKIVAKFDIEGSEFLVLPHLVERNMLCKGILDEIAIEWHELSFPAEQRTQASHLHKQFSTLLAQQKCSNGPTLVRDLDDETFLHDGQML
jgi:hypothetical protein